MHHVKIFSNLLFWSKSHYPFWSYFPFLIKILILFVLYVKNYKRQMVSWNCKHVQHVKIYLPCNFEVNLITHLGVIALFSSFFFFILIFFVLYFKNYLEIDVKFKLQKCAACQDLPTLQFWSNPITHFGVIVLFSSPFRPCELLPSLFVRPSTFHILIFSSETTGPIATKLWWNGPWMTPFQKCVRWSQLPTKMAAKLKIEKRGDEILIVHCCFSISQNEIKF